MASKDLTFAIIGDSSSGVNAVNRFGDAIEGVRVSGGANLTKISAIAGGVAGAVATVTNRILDSVGSLASEAVGASDGVDKFKKTLDFAKVDNGTIEKLAGQTRAYADATVYDLNTIQNTTAQLAANSVPNYAALTEAAGNLNAVAGGNAETFRSVSMTLTQTAGAGKLTTENWNQLSDAIPGASGVIQAALLKNGAYTGNFREAMEKGQISSDEFNQSLLELGSQPIAVEAAKSTVTLEGALGGLQATIVGGLSDAITTMKPLITGAVNGASTVLGGFFGWFGGAFQGTVDLVAGGQFTEAFRTAFHVEEDSPVVGFLANVRDGIRGVWDLVGTGDFTTAFATAFNVSEDAPVVNTILTIRESVIDFSSAVSTALGGLGPVLLALWQALSPVSLIFQALIPELPQLTAVVTNVAVAVTDLAVGAFGALIPILSTVIGWISGLASWLIQHEEIVLAVGVAWLTWKGISGTLGLIRAAQLGYAAATYGATAATYANTAAGGAQAIAARAGAAALAFQNTALYGSIAAWWANTTAVATNNSLTLGTKAAIIASSAATGIATAAQWAWNAALSANPIGVIIMAIAALVAGLVWFFTQTELGKGIWDTVVGAISTAVTWLWESVLSPVFTAIGAIFTWVYENIITPIVNAIVVYVQVWAAIFTWLWNSILSPIFQVIGAIFGWLFNNIVMPIVNAIVVYVQVWAAIFTWLWETILSPIFQAIGAVFVWVWQTVIQPIVDAIGLAMQGMGIVFTWVYENVIRPVWEGISSAIGAAWNWIDQYVFSPFRVGIELLGQMFQGVAQTIGVAWEGIKQAAAAPINFVLDTVWNNGLRSFWNDLVTGLNLGHLALPEAPLVKFAEGGVMPGYTPGKDVHQFWSPTAGGLALSGGEAIMRPEFTRAVGGAAGVDRLNRAARSGTLTGDGGGFLGDVWNAVQGAASVAWEFLSDPAAAIQKNIVDGIIRPLMSSNDGSSVIAQAVGEMPIRLVQGMADVFAASAPDRSGAGMGWEAIWRIVEQGVPGARMTSNYRPGAVTVNGGQSYHGLGRAIDIVPATMTVFDQVARLFPDARELIYTPAGGRQLLNGQQTTWGGAVAAQHWDHIHLAMANGGVLPDLPRLATGGVTTSAMAAIIGDNPGGREVVQPLVTYREDNRQTALEVAELVASSRNADGDVVIMLSGDAAPLLEQMDLRARIVVRDNETRRTQAVRAGRQRGV